MSRQPPKRARTRDAGQRAADALAVDDLRGRGGTPADAFRATARMARARADATQSISVRQEATDTEWRAWRDRARALPAGLERRAARENQATALAGHIDALLGRIDEETAAATRNQRLAATHEQAARGVRDTYNAALPVAVVLRLHNCDIPGMLPGIPQAERTALVRTIRLYLHNRGEHDMRLRIVDDLNAAVTERIEELRVLHENMHGRRFATGGGVGGEGGGGGGGVLPSAGPAGNTDLCMNA